MPYVESLNAKPITVAEAFSDSRRYLVPPFQRDYAWEQPQWEELWADLWAIGSSPEAGDHYLGAIVLQPTDERSELRIIDGQQRLVTLSILALAVIAHIEGLAAQGQDAENNRERVRLLRESFVSKKDAASLQHRPRIVLNQRDNSFYAAYLVQGKVHPRPRTLEGSERRLNDARIYFSKQLESRFPNATGAQLVEFLDQTVARRLRFIEIVVQNDETAFTVFETLNARGVALGTADLLKNYLFSKAATGGQADLEAAGQLWQRITARVPLEQLATMLFHQLAGQIESVRERRVFSEVKQLFGPPDPKNVFDFLRELEETADLYAALDDPSADLWADFPGCRQPLRVLNILDVHQCRPLILAAFRRFQEQPAKLARLLHSIANLSVRTTITHVNTGDVQRVYHSAALRTTRGELKSPARIADALRPIYSSDEDFQRSFELLSLNPKARSKQLLRYLFSRLEEAFGGQAIDFDASDATIEHILPENQGSDWDMFSPAERKSDLCRLGNLTPLEYALNKGLGAAPFPRKREVYATSGYALTRSVAYEEWTPAAVRARQRLMAAHAVQIWRLDDSDDS